MATANNIASNQLMKLSLLNVCVSAVLLTAGIAVNAQDITSHFDSGSFSLANQTLPYRVAEIGVTAAIQPVMVLYLHGGSSRGDDNEKQLNERAVSVVYQYLSNHNVPAIFIVPQCPTGGGWTGQLRRVLIELLKSYVNAGKVDENRIYVIGGSMGGTGTWCQLGNNPNFYAAAMPVAGNPTGQNAANVATTPVRTVMGTADALMSIEDVENFMTEVNEAGGTIILDVEDGWTHPMTCENSYTDERLDWLFAQSRHNTTTQIMNVKVGNLTYRFPTNETGKMTFEGNQLKIGDKTFDINEIDEITVVTDEE